MEESKEQVVEEVKTEATEEKKMTPEQTRAALNWYNTLRYNILQAAKSGKVRSINRAAKRGRFNMIGQLKPHRPFNNRKNTSKRKGADSRIAATEMKRIYEAIKRKSVTEQV